MSVSPDNIHIFIQYPLKYSASFITKRLKGISSRILKPEFPELKDGVRAVSGLQVAIMEVLDIVWNECGI